MRLLTISALLIATCAIFLGVGQSEETAKIEDVKETPIENDLTDVEKGEKLPDSFESDEANNDKDEEEGGKGEEEDRGEVPEEENKDEKEDENDEIDSSSLSENEVNSLEETSSDTEDTTGLSKRFFRRSPSESEYLNENADVQSDETVVHRFREDLSENDFAKMREFEAKAEKEVPQQRE